MLLMESLTRRPLVLAGTACLGVGGFLAVMRWKMADVYDIIIVRMTSTWYREVLMRLGRGTRVLDVGIGTATALLRNKELLAEKDLHVVGIDYEAPYVDKAKAAVKASGLQDRVEVHCRSVYDDLAALKPGGRPFDAGYFSGSITLLPDPGAALKAVAALVKPGGPIYVTQTFQLKHSPLMEKLKPLLKYLTTIDFGVLTYEDEMKQIVKTAGFRLAENVPIEGSIQRSTQSARLMVILPES
eukprot:TRINITY_DN32622_c0_g1_i1.p1 TRINITY_DN32622_c0_g1~~TRINITY_DN32622_c0_g1_i1.p1  ORF type:complete len:276 (-),score=64.10 TRINITY_DN32622_c0_g1_i1:60-785(-)